MVLCVHCCMCSLANLRNIEKLVDILFPLGAISTNAGILYVLKEACKKIDAKFAQLAPGQDYTHFITRRDGMQIDVNVTDFGVGYAINFCSGSGGAVLSSSIMKNETEAAAVENMKRCILKYERE